MAQDNFDCGLEDRLPTGGGVAMLSLKELLGRYTRIPLHKSTPKVNGSSRVGSQAESLKSGVPIYKTSHDDMHFQCCLWVLFTLSTK
jgi:hypothetical protein